MIVASATVAGSPIDSNPLITQAWRPRHMTSPTGRLVSRMAVAATRSASSKSGIETRTYGPIPRSLRAAVQPRGFAPPNGLSDRAWAISQRCCCDARDVRASSVVMLRAICRLAPTHHSRVYCET